MFEVCILHILTELCDLWHSFSFQAAWKVHTASGLFLTWMEQYWLVSSDSPAWHSAGQRRQMEQGATAMKQQWWAKQVLLCRQWWWWTGVWSGRSYHLFLCWIFTPMMCTDDVFLVFVIFSGLLLTDFAPLKDAPSLSRYSFNDDK